MLTVKGIPQLQRVKCISLYQKPLEEHWGMEVFLI